MSLPRNALFGAPPSFSGQFSGAPPPGVFSSAPPGFYYGDPSEVIPGRPSDLTTGDIPQPIISAGSWAYDPSLFKAFLQFLHFSGIMNLRLSSSLGQGVMTGSDLNSPIKIQYYQRTETGASCERVPIDGLSPSANICGRGITTDPIGE
jgi:hypothetical protein